MKCELNKQQVRSSPSPTEVISVCWGGVAVLHTRKSIGDSSQSDPLGPCSNISSTSCLVGLISCHTGSGNEKGRVLWSRPIVGGPVLRSSHNAPHWRGSLPLSYYQERRAAAEQDSVSKESCSKRRFYCVHTVRMQRCDVHQRVCSEALRRNQSQRSRSRKERCSRSGNIRTQV